MGMSRSLKGGEDNLSRKVPGNHTLTKVAGISIPMCCWTWTSQCYESLINLEQTKGGGNGSTAGDFLANILWLGSLPTGSFSSGGLGLGIKAKGEIVEARKA